jgi:hypothetical protein
VQVKTGTGLFAGGTFVCCLLYLRYLVEAHLAIRRRAYAKYRLMNLILQINVRSWTSLVC